MNPLQEQDQTASNVFIDGELSEEDLMKIAGGLLTARVYNSSSRGEFVAGQTHLNLIDKKMKICAADKLENCLTTEPYLHKQNL